MFFKQWLHSSIVRFSLIAVVLSGITLVGSRSTGNAQASVTQSVTNSPIQQNNAVAAEAVPDATSGTIRIECPPQVVYVSVVDGGYGEMNFFSAGCPGAGDIEYWQFSGDSKKANQILAIALSAQATGRSVYIFYDPTDTTGLADPAHRRKIVALGVK